MIHSTYTPLLGRPSTRQSSTSPCGQNLQGSKKETGEKGKEEGKDSLERGEDMWGNGQGNKCNSNERNLSDEALLQADGVSKKLFGWS